MWLPQGGHSIHSEVEELRKKLLRANRELEVKNLYLEDKEMFWSGEMQLLNERTKVIVSRCSCVAFCI